MAAARMDDLDRDPQPSSNLSYGDLMEKSHRSQAEPSPPLIWPSAAKQVHNGGVPLVQHALKNSAAVLGMASAVDSKGVTWIDSFLRDEPSLCVQVILAVFGGCPTRRDDLSRLLVIQDRAEGGQVQFRVLPMADGPGAPANCLLAVPADGTPSAFLFGPTPNFGIDDADRTQINMWFEAEPSLVDQWGGWFDLIWRQAAPLTEATADIPALVPASGTPAAAAQWETYCDLCAQSVKQPEGRVIPDPGTGEMTSEEGSGSEDPSPTELAGLPKLDPLVDRVVRLFRAGQQVTIASSSAVGPLRVPVSPRLLGQEATVRHGMVAQHQSFSISAFTDEELKEIEKHRQATRTILEKMCLPLGKGDYWLPNQATRILEREWEVANENAQRKLGELVNGEADDYVASKLDSIKKDLNGVYQRLGGTGEVPKDLLSRVVSELEQRIAQALDCQLCAQVAFLGIQFVPPMKLDCQAPWEQAEKLVLALARFPRKAIAAKWGPGWYLAQLEADAEEVLKAMDVANDEILKGLDERRTKGRAQSELKVLDQVSEAEISSRDRCQGGLMVIDGSTTDDIDRFIREAVSKTE